MEPTSEQELKALLEEGKITQEEYEQLLGAIHQKDKSPSGFDVPVQPKSRAGFGRTALILMLAGILLPLVLFALAVVSGGGLKWAVLSIIVGTLCVPCEIAAFIFGIIGWKSPAGKVAAIGVPAMGVVLIMFSLIVPVLAYQRVKAVPQGGESAKNSVESYRAYPLDSMEGVIQQEDIVFDPVISSDGKGSLRIHANRMDKTIFRLFETGPMSIDYSMLIYSAKLRSSDVAGKAYLEMWCDISSQGEFFSRGVEQPVTGTTEWTSVQTPFRLESGQMPANIKLNLVVEGTGLVWIDDIKLLSGPLH